MRRHQAVFWQFNAFAAAYGAQNSAQSPVCFLAVFSRLRFRMADGDASIGKADYCQSHSYIFMPAAGGQDIVVIRLCAISFTYRFYIANYL